MGMGSTDFIRKYRRLAKLNWGARDRSSAAAPVTCGAAIEVPDIVVCPPPILVDTIASPGAAMSTTLPQFESGAFASA